MSTLSRYCYNTLEEQWLSGWQEWFTNYLETHQFSTDPTNLRWWEMDFRDKKLWSDISSNPNLTLAVVKKYPDHPWNWFMISSHVHLTLDLFIENRHLPWDNGGLCCNPCFTPDWFSVIGFTNVDWNWYSRNPNLTWATVLKHQTQPWNWDYISKHREITWDMVERHSFPWTWWGLGKNPNTPWSELCRNPYKWYDISRHPRLQWSDVVEYRPTPEQKTHWNWIELSQHSNITWDTIQQNPNYPWCPKSVSANPNVSLKTVIDHPNYRWDWGQLSKHLNITWSMIQEHPELPWQWQYVSRNPNITWDIVQQNPDYAWDYDGLVTNSMVRGKTDWIQQRRFDIIASLQLQRHWRTCSNNPQYRLGKKLVLTRAGYSP